MVLFAATSCFGTTDGTDTLPLDSDSDSSATTPAPKPEFLDIMKDGEFKATIVVVDDGNDYYMIANKLVMSIAKKYDVYPDIEYDTDLDVDSDRVEILIGATNRPESAESKSKLSRSDDYLCELSGNKLLLMGLNEKSTAKAVDYFIYEYITFGEDNSIVYSIADDFFYFNKNSIEINTCAGNPLENYTIVYPADSTMGEYYVALNLRYHMFKKLGMDIPVTDDTANAKTLEILIGDTNRNLAPTVPNGKFSIAVKNSKLCIAANDFFGYLSADKYLTDTLFTNKSEPDTLSASYTYSATADVRPARQGDYRILFNNTWGLHDVAFANRDEYAAAFYLAYQADVVALNELWDPYRADGVIDDVLLANGYVEVIAPNKTEHGDPNTNVLPIFYNPKKVKLIESSYHHSKWYAIGSRGDDC